MFRSRTPAAVRRAHVLAAEWLNADDMTVPVLAKGETRASRCWIYTRRPFLYSRDRSGAHAAEHLARRQVVLQGNSFRGYYALYVTDRHSGPIREAGYRAHARRKFFELADIAAEARSKVTGKTSAPISPMDLEAVQRIDSLLEIERGNNGATPERRIRVRQAPLKPLVAKLQT